MKHVSAEVDGLLLVDKGPAVTSHDVVGLTRRALRTRAVGHAGTLDPMATGVLVLGVGEGTKLLRFLESDRKRYRATVQLGWATDSGDADGQATLECPVPVLTQETLEAAAKRFTGHFQQRPPAISAIKQGGEALYKKVRRGEQVTVPLRDVHVGELHVHLAAPDKVELEVECSKGFYVRSLGVDLAQALGTEGHLCALRRVRSGAFDLARSLPMERLFEAKAGDEEARLSVVAHVVPLATALRAMPCAELDEAGCLDARCGRPVVRERIQKLDEAAEFTAGPVALYDGQGVPLAVAQWREGTLRVVRGFVQRLGATSP